MTSIRCAVTLLCACATCTFVVHAQSISAPLQFEVASVKPNPTRIAEFVQSKGGDSSVVLQAIGIQTLPGGGSSRSMSRFASWFFARSTSSRISSKEGRRG